MFIWAQMFWSSWSDSAQDASTFFFLVVLLRTSSKPAADGSVPEGRRTFIGSLFWFLTIGSFVEEEVDFTLLETLQEVGAVKLKLDWFSPSNSCWAPKELKPLRTLSGCDPVGRRQKHELGFLRPVNSKTVFDFGFVSEVKKTLGSRSNLSLQIRPGKLTCPNYHTFLFFLSLTLRTFCSYCCLFVAIRQVAMASTAAVSCGWTEM